jgi:transcriptional regulator with XRE-family HTH domain
MRRAAGLTGKQLAEATGQHFTRISRIENGGQAPTDRNIRDWCTVCGAADQIADLIASAQSIESAYLEWSRQARAGMKRLVLQPDVVAYGGSSRLR